MHFSSASSVHIERDVGMNKFDRTIAHEKLLKQCLLEMTTVGWLCWNNRTGAIKAGGRFQHYGLVGSSDIIAIDTDGRFIACEIKTGNAVQNKAQKAFEQAVKKRNGIYKIIHTYEELKEWLTTYS